jgi:hypothetical protein
MSMHDQHRRSRAPSGRERHVEGRRHGRHDAERGDGFGYVRADVHRAIVVVVSVCSWSRGRQFRLCLRVPTDMRVHRAPAMVVGRVVVRVRVHEEPQDRGHRHHEYERSRDDSATHGGSLLRNGVVAA